MPQDKYIVLTYRATEDLYERIYRFAEDNGLYNAKDEPNISATTVLLISLALEGASGDQQRLIQQAYEAGITHGFNVLIERFDEWVSAVRDELRSKMS